MRLSELMSHMGLTFFPIVALVMFLAVFAAAVLYVIRGKATFARSATLPLDDGKEVRGES